MDYYFVHIFIYTLPKLVTSYTFNAISSETVAKSSWSAEREILVMADICDL